MSLLHYADTQFSENYLIASRRTDHLFSDDDRFRGRIVLDVDAMRTTLMAIVVAPF